MNHITGNQKLGIDFNETTPDGKFTLKEGECMGACGDAPVMLVNNKRMCSFMLPEEIDKLLAECNWDGTDFGNPVNSSSPQDSKNKDNNNTIKILTLIFFKIVKGFKLFSIYTVKATKS